MKAIEIDAPAKVNLWLRVFQREASGFHGLDTLFCALELADRLRVERGGSGVRLEVRGADLGAPETNLAFRAAHAFLELTRAAEGVSVVLDKHIPAGAGLGGGSSDAAATLRALNLLHDRPLLPSVLSSLGAAIGSDVPFFLADAVLARGTGRGDRLDPLPPLPPRPVLVAMPPFRVGTADAYRMLDAARGAPLPAPSPSHSAAGVPAVAGWEDVARRSSNDFEGVLFEAHPLLARLQSALERAGARPARLSGSGAAVYGIFESATARDSAASHLGRAHPETAFIRTATRTRTPRP